MPEKPGKKQKDSDPIEKFRNQKFYTTIWISSISVGVIALFGLVGYGIDSYLNSRPFGMIIAVLISFPIAQVLIYKKVKQDILKK